MIRIVVGLVLLLVSAGCIKVETGQTADEAKASAAERGKQARAEWASQLNQASPNEMMTLFIEYGRFVTDRLLAYGHDVSQQWREGNAGRGEDVPAGEMQEVIAAWIDPERPVLKAWEDNLEYGLRRIEEIEHFNEETLSLAKDLIDQYYDVYSAVFYPAGDVEDYEDALLEAQNGTADILDDLEREAEKY